jgi:dolichol-phosphate mannosyltransferase
MIRKMNKIFAILPCYNEELNIGELIDKWYAQKDGLLESGYELVIVGIDDCSTDNTKKIIEGKSEEYSNTFLYAHPVNKGLVGGLNSAISYFLDNGSEGDLMTLMDGDNTHDPKYVHAMLKKLKDENKDCVIASRYCKDSEVVGVAGHREFMSDMAKLYYSFVLRVPDVKDYTCGYRIYTYDIIKKLVDEYGKDPIVEKSFACMMELLYKIYTVGATFGETGFELRYDNKQGASKMNVFKTMKKSLSTAVKLRSANKRNRKK